MSEEYNEMEKLLRDVDFTKGSDHKNRLRNRLSEATGDIPGCNEPDPDELDLDGLNLVRAAVKRDEGIDISGKSRKK